MPLTNTDAQNPQYQQTESKKSLKRSTHCDQEGFMQMCKAGYHILKSTVITQHINRLRKKSHMIIPIDGGKAFVKILHPFRINSLSNLGTEGSFLHSIKIYKQPQLPLHSMMKTDSFPAKIRYWAGTSPLADSFTAASEVLVMQ